MALLLETKVRDDGFDSPPSVDQVDLNHRTPPYEQTPHRVPVVEEDGALAGIISTMDILAALVNTHDELE